MKARLFLFLLQVFTIYSSLNSQSVYHLKYKSPDVKDTTTYDAFFVRYNNGAGFIRIIQAGKTDVKAEMEIQEQYAMDKRVIDTAKLIYEKTNLTFIPGGSKFKFPAVIFWFKINAENNYDPWGITASTSVQPPEQGNFLLAEFISNEDILKNKELVLLFFAEKDPYYSNLFGPKSKGGTLSVEERKNTKLRLIMVASTYDDSIGVSCSKDSRKTVETFMNVAATLGIGSVIDTIFGDKYNKPNVEAAINKLKPGPNDIVIFYYSGHGFTDLKISQKNFPFLDLRDPRLALRPRPETQTLNIQDIYQTIIKKGARLNLVISDCCNTEIGVQKGIGISDPGSKGIEAKWNFENVKALFIKERLSLLITAAGKGEKAWCNDKTGGFFTDYFISSLKAFMGPTKGTAMWTDVLVEAQKQTIKKAERYNLQQHPKILIPK